MPITLDSTLISEKNLLHSSSPWVMLAYIDFGGGDTMKLAANTDDVVWDGNTYVAFPFTIDVIQESTVNEVPQIVCRVSNINQAVQYYVEQEEGGIDTDVTLSLVNLNNLSDTNVPSFDFVVTGCKIDSKWCHFTLGAPSPFNKVDPKNRILKNFCRFSFPSSVDSRCPYSGVTYTECNKTFADCQERNGDDAKYYGGFPGVSSSALWR